MPGEREESSERLAGFIVSSLHDANMVGAADIPRATTIATEEIDVNKAMGDYWCSWCSLRPKSAFGVHADDESIRLATDGLEFQLKRISRVDHDGRIGVETRARADSFNGRYTTAMRVADLLRFASELRAIHGASTPGGVATLRNTAGDAVIEVTSSTTASRYLFKIQKANGATTTLAGSFITDATSLGALARELRSLVHDSWAKA